jgi:Ubiquitin-like modifier-activating enzyme ATG7 N-terminus
MMASSHSADASATTATTTSGSNTTTTAADGDDTIVLKFVPFQSAVESAFWVRYCRAKLETIQLNETAVPLQLSYSPVNSNNSNAPRLQCRDHSLQILQETSDNNNININNECRQESLVVRSLCVTVLPR